MFRKTMGKVLLMTSPAGLVCALFVGMIAPAVVIPSVAHAYDHECKNWVNPNRGQRVGGNRATLKVNVDVYRAPRHEHKCDRGQDYRRGTTVELHGQSGGFYYVRNPYIGSRGDWGWVLKTSVKIGSGVQTESRSNVPQTSTPARSNNNSGTSNSFISCNSLHKPKQYMDPNSRFTRKARTAYIHRMGPSTSSRCDRGARIYKGDSIYVMAKSNGWYFVVNRRNGLWGWVKNGVF